MSETTTTALTSIKSENSNELIQLVSFNLDEEEYGVEVLKVREIIRMANITHMPNAPHYIEGIINLRGKVIPVISMRKKFGLQERGNSNSTRIMVMDVRGDLLGFIVDGVSEVIRIAGSEIQSPPMAVSLDPSQECITGVISRGDRLLVVMEVGRLLDSSDYDTLAATE